MELNTQSSNDLQGRQPDGNGFKPFDKREWERDWKEVTLGTCLRGVDDGLSRGLDGLSAAKRRTERLKMLGNSIVPQVAVEIMKAIKASEKRVGQESAGNHAHPGGHPSLSLSGVNDKEIK